MEKRFDSNSTFLRQMNGNSACELKNKPDKYFSFFLSIFFFGGGGGEGGV